MTQKLKSKSSRNWCATFYSQEELEIAKSLDIRKYLIWGDEICPKTGNLHYQAYIELNDKVRIAALKKKGLKTTHFEARQGTQQQAIDYCKKDGKWQEIGTVKTDQGKRNDILQVKEMIDKGETMEAIADAHFGFFIKHDKALLRYKALKLKDRTEQPKLIIYWGISGTGKTYKAIQDNPGAYCLTQSSSEGGKVWWDGYEQQPVVIVDEFYGWMRWSYLLTLINHLPLIVENKGGSTKFNSPTIIMTSNMDPLKWYKKIDDLAPLLRRITECYYFSSQGIYKPDNIKNRYHSIEEIDP